MAVVRYYTTLLLLTGLSTAWLPAALGQDLPEGMDETYAVTTAHRLLVGKANALVRVDLTTFEVQDFGKATEHVRRAVTVLTPEGRDDGRLIIGYDRLHRLKSLKGVLFDADGNVVRKLEKHDVDDFSAISGFSLYEENRVRVAEMYHDVYPFTVEYEYEIAYDGLINWPTWYPQWHGNPVEYARLVISAPKAVSIRHAERNTDIEPETRLLGDRTEMRWEIQWAPPFRREPYGPSVVAEGPVVYTAPARFEVEGTFGDMRTWESFGAWYRDLSDGMQALPDEAVATVRALTEGAQSDLEKVQRIYAYLQKTTRYVSVQLGLGGWRPYDAAYVYEHGYGDCKALTNYMIAMLRAVGVPAYPALIRNGRWEPDVLADFPSSQFNHVVAYVPLADGAIWLECTSQSIPFGHISASNENRHALVIGQDGGRLVRTPTSIPTDNRQVHSGSIRLAADGAAEIVVSTRYTGNQQDRVRGALDGASTRDRAEWLHRTLDLPTFNVVKADYSNVDRGGRELVLPLDLKLAQFGTRTGTRLFFNPTIMDRWTEVPPKMDKERKQPVSYFPYAFVDTDTLDYMLPTGFKVEAAPRPLRIETRFGRFESNVTPLPNGSLRYTRLLEISETDSPPESYGAFRDFFRQVARSDGQQVVLVRSE